MFKSPREEPEVFVTCPERRVPGERPAISFPYAAICWIRKNIRAGNPDCKYCQFSSPNVIRTQNARYLILSARLSARLSHRCRNEQRWSVCDTFCYIPDVLCVDTLDDRPDFVLSERSGLIVGHRLSDKDIEGDAAWKTKMPMRSREVGRWRRWEHREHIFKMMSKLRSIGLDA